MPITIGTQLGSHEITALLGKGGMGEVYRARDLKLKREVAIKILPDEFSRDADRVNRFQREAEVLASLNHPNIAGIHELAEANGSRYLVLELVEGETLADRIERGLIPVDEALVIAKSICEALEAAHEKGIVHCDLKPANIKITPDGKVKVLDFGLAKLSRARSASTDLAPSDVPTASWAQTEEGTIFGTAAYMSPEQARGKAVDKRTDIWAFGCVLYEMLSGHQMFVGTTASDSIAKILKDDPDWSALPATVPHGLRDQLRRCLARDPSQRLHDIADARIELEEVRTSGIRVQTISEKVPRSVTVRFAVGLALLFLMMGIAGTVFWSPKSTSRQTARPVARFTVALPATERPTGLDFPTVALSSDGTHLAYVADNHRGSDQLYVRHIDKSDPSAIPNTQNAAMPFFSPDSKWLGFFAEGKLKKVSLNGGTPLILADAPNPRGASWGSDDVIVFAPAAASALFRISANGGSLQAATTLDSDKRETAHRWPDVLPGGQSVIFSAGPADSGWDDTEIVVQSLQTGSRHVVLRGGAYARYVPTGHLIYAHAGTVFAVPFNLTRLEVTGDPIPVVEGVVQSANTIAAQFTFSNVGDFVYIPRFTEGSRRKLVWVDRKGTSQPLQAPVRPYSQPRLSPDERRIAVQVETEQNDIWIYDILRDTLARLTLETDSAFPEWTPDGSRVGFHVSKGSGPGLFWKRADGTGVQERLTTSPLPQVPQSWSPNGRLLAFHEASPSTSRDIWLLPLDGERKPRLLLGGQYSERVPLFSPDGKWLAYLSDESGQEELYVQPFPGPGGKWQVSTDGASEPVWARNGRELLYRIGDKLMSVNITTQPAFQASKPMTVLEGRYVNNIGRANYDISADGQRFLMIEPAGPEAQSIQLNVVLEWFRELQQRVPVK